MMGRILLTQASLDDAIERLVVASKNLVQKRDALRDAENNHARAVTNYTETVHLLSLQKEELAQVRRAIGLDTITEDVV